MTVGSRAGAFGGVTSLVDFAAPKAGLNLVEALKRRQGQADGQVVTDYDLNLTLRDPVWRDTRMIEVNRPRIEVAGQLVFADSSGTQSQTTVATSVNPKLI